MIKQIFCDLDGTLLNDEGKLSVENIKALQSCKIPITLVSARAPIEMFDVIEKVPLTGPQVAFNGGLVFQRENSSTNILVENPISSYLVESILKFINKYFSNVSLSCYDHSNWYACKSDEGIKFEQKLTGQNVTIVSQADIYQKKIFKIMLITFDKLEMWKLYHELRYQYLLEVNIQRSGMMYLEITSFYADKSHGIRNVAQNLKKVSWLHLEIVKMICQCLM